MMDQARGLVALRKVDADEGWCWRRRYCRLMRYLGRDEVASSEAAEVARTVIHDFHVRNNLEVSVCSSKSRHRPRVEPPI